MVLAHFPDALHDYALSHGGWLDDLDSPATGCHFGALAVEPCREPPFAIVCTSVHAIGEGGFCLRGLVPEVDPHPVQEE